jgi:hypothetical protein
MPEPRSSRTKVAVSLLLGSVLPVVVGKYLLPEYIWWLFGLSCAIVIAGTAILVLGGRDGPDAP